MNSVCGPDAAVPSLSEDTWGWAWPNYRILLQNKKGAPGTVSKTAWMALPAGEPHWSLALRLGTQGTEQLSCKDGADGRWGLSLPGSAIGRVSRQWGIGKWQNDVCFRSIHLAHSAGWMVEPDPTWTLKRCTQRTDFFSSKRHMYQWDALDLPFHIRSLFQKPTTHRDQGVLKWVCPSCWRMWTDKTTGLHVSQKLQNGPVLWSLGIYPWKITQTFFS